MNTEAPEEKYQQVQFEHRRLKTLFRQIEFALETRSATIDEVSTLLGHLGNELSKHFQSEEAGGYFAEALLHAPQLVVRANELMLQHPKMTEDARKLAGAVDPADDPDGWWEQTQERFQAFLDELKKHETGEDGLIQEAYTRDIGSQD